ncbi:MAG TPA: helix-turn-helix domain-containing protein [Stellaceae bacterium]|jgi:AraC-like DNA-binding protein
MPSSEVHTFTDPDAYHAAIRDSHAEGVITGRGDFRAELTAVRLYRLSLQRIVETLPRIAYSAIDPNVLAVIFPIGPDQQAYISGVELSSGEIAVFRAGSEGYNRNLTARRWGSIALAHEDVAAAGQAIIGRELTASPVTRRIKPPSALLLRLLNLHEAAGQLAKTAPEILLKAELARAMDQALVEAMISCLAGGDPVEVRSAHRHHAMVMRRLERALQANSEGPLYMAELCAAAGVSYRTLRICCQEHLGMGPKRYLLLRRMHLAWRALRQADPATTTVTEIATDYGFWELGRFSVAYRSFFGESPSATLRRPPDDPKPKEITGSPWNFTKSA